MEPSSNCRYRVNILLRHDFFWDSDFVFMLIFKKSLERKKKKVIKRYYVLVLILSYSCKKQSKSSAWLLFIYCHCLKLVNSFCISLQVQKEFEVLQYSILIIHKIISTQESFFKFLRNLSDIIRNIFGSKRKMTQK